MGLFNLKEIRIKAYNLNWFLYPVVKNTEPKTEKDSFSTDVCTNDSYSKKYSIRVIIILRSGNRDVTGKNKHNKGQFNFEK